MTEYKRQTESKHTIDLPSKIRTCYWRWHDAPIGKEVNFHIGTEFVADKTVVIITITDKSGSVNEKVEGEIEENEFRGKYKVPENAEDYLELSVSIPDYSLEAKSKKLLVLKNITVNLVDEYENQIEDNTSFEETYFKITTDTNDHRTGKVIDKKVYAENVHYLNEFKLELSGGIPKEGRTLVQKRGAANSEEASSGYTPIKKPETIELKSIGSESKSGDNKSKDKDKKFDDFANFIRKTYEKLKDSVKNLKQ